MRRTVRLFGCLAACALLQACSLMRLREDNLAQEAALWLQGRVLAGADSAGPVVLAAYMQPGQPAAPARTLWLHEAGTFELMLPRAARQVLLAFADNNGNARWDAGEACVAVDIDTSSLAGTQASVLLDLRQPSPSTACILASGSSFVEQAGRVASAGGLPRSWQAGALARLDDAHLSADNGMVGYWTPMRYLQETGANIEFLQAYDPDRIPVLFVHGAAGSPQDWRYFMRHLDAKRYQPWFFHYPSGASMELNAALLLRRLQALQARHGLQTLAVVAHSMGGLLVRSLLVEHGSELPFVSTLVTLSTPWGGEPLSDAGVQLAPAVVPSWRDLQPQGPFLNALYAQPLPAPLPHHLLFSFRAKGRISRLLRPNNDGSVTLQSQLHPAAQAGAATLWGFDEDHDSILQSPQALARLHALLLAIPSPTSSPQPQAVALRR
jgi:pimeloyl-ACP methyl ester carboxylesterase